MDPFQHAFGSDPDPRPRSGRGGDCEGRRRGPDRRCSCVLAYLCDPPGRGRGRSPTCPSGPSALVAVAGALEALPRSLKPTPARPSHRSSPPHSLVPVLVLDRVKQGHLGAFPVTKDGDSGHGPDRGKSCNPREKAKNRRAGEGTRTLDIQLGKLALYQLSYARDAAAV